MLYSVYNHRTRRYDYYEALGDHGPTHAPAPKHVRAVTQLGSTPSQAAWPLPMGARKVGSGDAARGRIAKIGTGMGGLGALELGTARPLVLAGGLVAAALLARRYLR